MKEWSIDIEETQKYFDEKYTENRYLVEPRGYNKDTFMEEIWIFVNEIIDKRLDENIEMSMSEINKISHLFRVGHYLICVYTSATDEDLYKKLENIYVYSYLNHYSDTNDESGKKLKSQADKLEEKVANETSFIRSELLSNDYDYILNLMANDKRFLSNVPGQPGSDFFRRCHKFLRNRQRR